MTPLWRQLERAEERVGHLRAAQQPGSHCAGPGFAGLLDAIEQELSLLRDDLGALEALGADAVHGLERMLERSLAQVERSIDAAEARVDASRAGG